MKLTKKETKPVQQTSNKPSVADKELHKVDMNCCAPVGKYQGKTLHWIKANDNNYWSWMEREHIAWSWGCTKLKADAMKVHTDKPRWQVFISHLGEQWCTIRVVEEKTQPAEEWWYKEQ